MRPRTDARPSGSRAGRLADAGLVVAAVLGAGALCWWVLCQWFGFGLVSFATGSMAPAYPAGSVAVSRALPVAAVRPGDVVTVARTGGELPITHRVTAVRTHLGVATLVLKGDANRTPDPLPYRVTRLREVVLPLPMPADLLRLASGPAGLGAVTVVLAFVVMRALWPEQEVERERIA